MRRTRTSHLLAFATMFLISPLARGYSPKTWSEPGEPIAAWQHRMMTTCVNDFRNQFRAWSRLDDADGVRLATALCTQARVYWPFVEVRDNLNYERTLPLLKTSGARPLILGLSGGPARVSSEVLQAMRHTLYPSSSMLWRWREDRPAFEEWLGNERGGRMGGVMYVEIDGPTPARVAEQVARARRAIEYVGDPRNELGEYTLVIDVRVYGTHVFEQLPVDEWVRVGSADCPRLLASDVL